MVNNVEVSEAVLEAMRREAQASVQDIIHLAISGQIEIAVSEPILDETIRVLREKFGWQPYIYTICVSAY